MSENDKKHGSTKYDTARKSKNGLLERLRLDPVKDVLTPGERVIHEGRIHWGIFLPVIGCLVIALIIGIVLHWFVGAVVVLMTLVPLTSKTIRFYTTLLVLTNKRVFVKFGYFNKDLIQIRISRLESANIERPFIGQLLGYSTVSVLGTGAGRIPVDYIANGREFVRALEKITLAHENSDKRAETKKTEGADVKNTTNENTNTEDDLPEDDKS